ncbi:MAG: ABC transporter ATP-binding protein [Candidatus Hodarchaeota archaeon]
MILLEIRNLWLKYNGSSRYNLQGINLTAKQGELLVIAGASGSGKSTLAQAILRLIPVFVEAELKGEIKIGDKLIENLSRKELLQWMGYVPQYPADFVTASLVEEELSFPLENLGLPQQKIQQRVKEVMDQLNIAHLQFRLMTELSAGELQRVALATALALSPPIIILDEPMARIDPKTEIIVAQMLQKLAEKDHLVLAFEHRLDYLLPLASRLILLEDGKISAKGQPRMILDSLEDVDLPEVSKLDETILNKRPLDLEEACSLLLRIKSKNPS